MKYLNFTNFSLPSSSTILSDISHWNSSFNGFFSVYPLGTDKLALHRNPLKWEPTNKFSSFYFDKEHETFSFTKIGSETSIILPCSSFIFDSETSSFVFNSLSDEAISLANQIFNFEGATFSFFYRNKEFVFRNKGNSSSLTITDEQISFSKVDSPTYFILDSDSLSIHGFENSFSVSKDGFKTTTNDENLNLVLIPYQNKENEMITSPSANEYLVDDFLFNGIHETSRNKADSTNLSYFFFKMGLSEKFIDGVYKGNVFSRSDFDLPDDSVYRTIGLIKLNVRGTKTNKSGAHIGIRFDGTRICFPDPAFMDLQKIGLAFSFENEIPGIKNKVVGRYYSYALGTTVDWNGEEKSLFTLFEGKIHGISAASAFWFNIFTGGKGKPIPFGFKILVRIQARRIGELLHINLVFSFFPFLSRTVKKQEGDIAYYWKKKNIKISGSPALESELYSMIGLEHVISTTAMPFVCEEQKIPVFLSPVLNDRKYFSIGSPSLPLLDCYSMNESVPTLTPVKQYCYFANHTLLYLPQNILSFGIDSGVDNYNVTNIVIPYTDYEMRAGVSALYKSKGLQIYKAVISIFIFNVVPFNIDLPNCSFDINNWKPEPNFFQNFGTSSTSCEIFLVSNPTIESSITDYDLLLSNACLQSSSSLVIKRWMESGTNSYIARFLFKVENNGSLYPSTYQGQSSYSNDYKTAVLDPPEYIIQVSNDPIKYVHGTIKDFLKHAKHFEIVVDDHSSSPQKLTIYFESTNLIFVV